MLPNVLATDSFAWQKHTTNIYAHFRPEINEHQVSPAREPDKKLLVLI